MKLCESIGMRENNVKKTDPVSSKNIGYAVSGRRKVWFAAALGIMISFCYTAGSFLERYDSVDLKNKLFYLKWLMGAVVVSTVLYLLWEMADRREKAVPEAGWRKTLKKIGFPLPWWGCMVVLLLCWLPAWFSLFPGAFSYDAFAEWEQVRDGALTAHHPLLHVIWLGGLVEGLHGLTGSYNTGIAVYTFIQMLLLAGIFAYTLHFLKEFEMPAVIQWAALLFYGLSPVIQLFAICATKDVIFSGVQLIFLLDILRVCCRGEEFSRKNWTFLGINAFFTMILRNNGLYIVLGTLVIMLAMLKKYRKELACILLGLGMAYSIFTGPVYGLLHVTAGGIEEMLSVPIQQMARAHKYDYESLDQEDLEIVYEVLPKEYLDDYRATVSDFVKKGFNREAFSARKGETFKIWLKWGKEHPLTYVNSFLVNTVDFWYPHAVVDGYRDPYGRSSFFDYRVSEPGTETVFLPQLHRYYEKISSDRQAQEAPFAFLLLSPGWYLVIMMVIFGYAWRCRRYEFAAAGIMFGLSFLTVLMGPMALVRYVLIFYYAFPVLTTVYLLPGHFRSRQKQENDYG